MATGQDTLDALAAQVTSTTDTMASAVVCLNGTLARQEAAVAAALANGATAAQLAPITDEIALMRGKTDELATAIVANTPAAAQSRR